MDVSFIFEHNRYSNNDFEQIIQRMSSLLTRCVLGYLELKRGGSLGF